MWVDDAAGLPQRDALRRRPQLGAPVAPPVRPRHGRAARRGRGSGSATRRPARCASCVLHHHMLGRAVAFAQAAGGRAETRARPARRVGRRARPRRAHPPEHRRRAARVRGLDAGRRSGPSSSRSRPASASPRPHRRGEALRPPRSTTRPRLELTVRTYVWDEDGLGLAGRAHVPARRAASQPGRPSPARRN